MTNLRKLDDMSPEERAEMIAKAQESRRINREKDVAHAEANFKLDYADEPEWREMASHLGVRMPVWYEAPTPKNIRKFLKKVDRDAGWFLDNNGLTKLNQWAKMNPTWSMFACAGLILEDLQEEL